MNARSKNQAKKIAFSIANSPLVKTAVAGEDANWGRLVMAIGKTQIKLEITKIKIYMQNFLLCENGKGINLVDELNLSKALKRKKVASDINLLLIQLISFQQLS